MTLLAALERRQLSEGWLRPFAIVRRFILGPNKAKTMTPKTRDPIKPEGKNTRINIHVEYRTARGEECSPNLKLNSTVCQL
jgi:hypothetical protein